MRHVIHADLKPANIMIDSRGDARVADFGLSHERRDAARTRTSLLGRQGTPMYMDPHLLTSGNSLIKACDIYSWAVLTWELCCASKPFPNAASADELFARVLRGERPDLSEIPSALADAGMSALLAECWAADPLLRPTMAQIVERMELIMLSVATRLGLSTPNGSLSPDAVHLAEELRLRASQEAKLMERNTALEVRDKLLPIEHLRLANRTTKGQGIGGMALLSNNHLVVGCLNGQVQVWDPSCKQLVTTFELNANPRGIVGYVVGKLASLASVFRPWPSNGAVACLPDGRIVSSHTKRLLVWAADKPTAAPVILTGHTAIIRSLCALPDGCVASAGDDAVVLIWDLTRRALVRKCVGHTGAVTSLVMCVHNDPKQSRLASAGYDARIRLWHPHSGEYDAVLLGHKSSITSLATMNDESGRLVLLSCSAGFWDKSIRVWDVSRKQPIKTVKHSFSFDIMAVMPGRRLLTISNADRRTASVVWDAVTWLTKKKLALHKHRYSYSMDQSLEEERTAIPITSICSLFDSRVAFAFQDGALIHADMDKLPQAYEPKSHKLRNGIIMLLAAAVTAAPAWLAFMSSMNWMIA
jgi:hypothetical protein